MSTLATRCLFVRSTTTLWRDTGRHVLALSARGNGEVVLLGGGGALLWRMLDEPLQLGAIEDRLAEFTRETPPVGAVESCLDDLVQRGFVELIEEDLP